MNRRFALLLFLCGATMPAQSDGPAVSVVQFLHIVADLDQSLAFYHDQLGLARRGPAGAPKFTDNPAVANLYGVPGRQFRAAVLNIPGSTFGIELVQWGDSAEPLRADGYARLMLYRVDGSPYRPDRYPTLLLDPDGLQLEVERAERVAVCVGIQADDVPKTAALYTKVFGFKADGKWLSTPGSDVRIWLGASRPSDVYSKPARAMLRLQVRNIDALTESLKSSGFSVITTGGAPVTLPQGPRVIILRDPNNFYWQLMEAPQK